MIDVCGARVDLHIHTWYSDGKASPGMIVEAAAEMGYSAIAITDHDGTGGIAEAVVAGRKLGVEIITGIELAAETENGTGFHILGYYFDVDDADMKYTLKRLEEKRKQRNRRLIQVLNDMGYHLSLDELQNSQKSGFVGKPVIARALEEKGYISDYREAFKAGQFLGSSEAKAVKKEKLSVSEAIDLIKRAGGIAVMAHPIQTRHIGDPGSEEFYENIEGYIADMTEMGLGGLECYHPDQNEDQSARFVKIAKKYGLWVTRGSDFHGADFRDAEPTA